MSESTRNIDAGKLVGGFILVGLGAVFLLDRFRVANFGDLINRFWPMIIVMLGLSKLFNPNTIWPGLWLISCGLWIQAVHLDLYGLTYMNSWPLLLIVLGAGTVLRTLFDAATRRRRSAAAGSEPDGR